MWRPRNQHEKSARFGRRNATLAMQTIKLMLLAGPLEQGQDSPAGCLLLLLLLSSKRTSGGPSPADAEITRAKRERQVGTSSDVLIVAGDSNGAR